MPKGMTGTAAHVPTEAEMKEADAAQRHARRQAKGICPGCGEFVWMSTDSDYHAKRCGSWDLLLDAAHLARRLRACGFSRTGRYSIGTVLAGCDVPEFEFMTGTRAETETQEKRRYVVTESWAPTWACIMAYSLSIGRPAPAMVWRRATINRADQDEEFRAAVMTAYRLRGHAGLRSVCGII